MRNLKIYNLFFKHNAYYFQPQYENSCFRLTVCFGNILIFEHCQKWFSKTMRMSNSLHVSKGLFLHFRFNADAILFGISLFQYAYKQETYRNYA